MLLENTMVDTYYECCISRTIFCIFPKNIIDVLETNLIYTSNDNNDVIPFGSIIDENTIDLSNFNEITIAEQIYVNINGNKNIALFKLQSKFL